MTGAFVCFIDSYLLFSLFGLPNSLRIRGYFITYPWLREFFALSSRFIGCMFLGFLILVVGFYSHKSHRFHEIFFHRWIFLSRETEFAARRGQRQSRESREVFFHRWFWSHTDLTNLTKAYIAYARMYHPAENTRRSRQARAKRRAICEICEICVR